MSELKIDYNEVASDLASFNSTGIETVAMELGVGLAGEVGTLRKYGIAVKETQIKGGDRAQTVMQLLLDGVAK